MTSRPLLAGIKVLDLAGEALTYAGRMLADLGGDVVIVEPPTGGPARRVPPVVGLPSGDTISAHFAFMAAGEHAVGLDIGVPEGRSVFARLMAWADVLLVSPTGGDLASTGFGVGQLHEINPRLVVTAVTPYGLRGPDRRHLGDDLTAWASGGVLPAVGDPDRAPLAPAGGLADMTAATNAAMGTLFALRTRRTTGRGQLVDISMQEAVLSVALEAGPYMVIETPATAQMRTGMRRDSPPIGQYRTNDGAVTIVAYMPWQWDALAAWIAEETGDDTVTLDMFRGTPAARAPFVEMIDGWVEELTTRYPKQAFAEEAQRRGIPATPVNSIADLLTDPHLAATDTWQEVTDPELGPIRYPRPPIRVDGEDRRVGAIPRPGEHTDDVLASIAGLSPDEIAELRRSAVI